MCGCGRSFSFESWWPCGEALAPELSYSGGPSTRVSEIESKPLSRGAFFCWSPSETTVFSSSAESSSSPKTKSAAAEDAAPSPYGGGCAEGPPALSGPVDGG